MVHVPGLQARRISAAWTASAATSVPTSMKAALASPKVRPWYRSIGSASQRPPTWTALWALGNPADVVVLLGPRLLEGCDRLILLVAMRRMGCDRQDLHAAL